MPEEYSEEEIEKGDSIYDENEPNGLGLSAVLKQPIEEKPKKKKAPVKKALTDKDKKLIKLNVDLIIEKAKICQHNCLKAELSKVIELAEEIKNLI